MYEVEIEVIELRLLKSFSAKQTGTIRVSEKQEIFAKNVQR